jgi:hypothetical protein
VARELRTSETRQLRLDGRQPGKSLTATGLDVAKQHRKEAKGEKREEGPRCSRWGDGVVMAGLSVAWHRCSGREGVPAR